MGGQIVNIIGVIAKLNNSDLRQYPSHLNHMKSNNLTTGKMTKQSVEDNILHTGTHS